MIYEWENPIVQNTYILIYCCVSMLNNETLNAKHALSNQLSIYDILSVIIKKAF